MSVFWYYRTDNPSPRVTEAFLAKQRRLLLPGQYAREHQNTWVEAADSFAAVADVDAAMIGTEAQRGRPGLGYIFAVDLGAVHDPTVIGLGHLFGEAVVVDRLVTFQGSKAEPVQLAVVERALLDLAQSFPPLLIQVESWQGLSVAQRLQASGLPVEIVTPSAKSNSEQWPILSRRLAERSLILPPHERLREELLNLTYEVTSTGVRVVDRGKIHQDHAVVVRMLCAALAPWCSDLPAPAEATPEVLRAEGAEAFARSFGGTPTPSGGWGNFVEDDTGQDYAGRDWRWSRNGRPLW